MSLRASEEVERAFRDARKICEDREEIYQDGWREEDLEDIYQNLFRKARALKTIFKRGVGSDDVAKEQLLDIINYSALVYGRIMGAKPTKPILLALDCPTRWLEIIQPLADFDWILAASVLRDERYKDFFKNSERTKIINNRERGKGSPVSVEDVKEAFDLVRGDLVVSPDWYQDHDKTFEAYVDFTKEFGKDKVLGVLQKDMDLAESLAVYDRKIAIPYDVGSTPEDSYWVKICRRALLVSNLIDREVHLLGFVTLEELSWYKDLPQVVSLNTGMPVWLGLVGRSIEDFAEDKTGDAYNLMDMDNDIPSPSKYKKVTQNILSLKKVLGG